MLAPHIPCRVIFMLIILLNILLISLLTYFFSIPHEQFSSTESEAFAYLSAVCFHYNCLMNKISLLLLSLLCQDMTVISVLSLDLSCSGKLETLLCCGFCFNFWHFFCFLIISNLWQRIYQDVTHIPFSFVCVRREHFNPYLNFVFIQLYFLSALSLQLYPSACFHRRFLP